MIQDWINWLPDLLTGLRTSVVVAAISLAFGLPLGLLLGLGTVAKSRVISWIAIAVVEVGRGTPVLVILYFLYFGLPASGMTLDSMTAAVIGIAFSCGAYTSEIYRAGILNVAQGQREAAQSLGFGALDETRYVIVPQMLKAITPALLSYCVIIFQATSLGFTIALPELLQQSYQIGSVTFQFLSVFILAGCLYAIITISATRAVALVEKRLST